VISAASTAISASSFAYASSIRVRNLRSSAEVLDELVEVRANERGLLHREAAVDVADSQQQIDDGDGVLGFHPSTLHESMR